jgi:hypothetical protein
MKHIARQHLVATIFPASLLETVREFRPSEGPRYPEEVVFLTGEQPIVGHRVQLIADEFTRSGKTVRIVRKL